jgi:hypothetical protein
MRTHATSLRQWLAARGLFAAASLVALVAATAGWRGAYAGGLGWVVLAAAALGGLVGLGAAPAGRRSTIAALGTSLVGLILYLCLVVNQSLDPHMLVSGIEHGPIQLISVSLPLAGGRSLLDTPAALAWVAGTAIGVLATTQPPMRIGVIMIVLLEEVASLAIGLASTIGGIVVALALIIVLLVAAPRTGERLDKVDLRVATLRRVRTGLEMLVVAVLLGATVLVVPGLGRAQPASLRRPPKPLTITVDDPIATVIDRGSAARTGRPWFRLTLDTPAPRYVSYLVLGNYNGVDWKLTSPRFAPAGELIPKVTRGITTLELTLRPLDRSLGPWIPAIGEPLAVIGAPMAYDRVDDMTVVNEEALPSRSFSEQDALGTSPTDVLAPSAPLPAQESLIPLGEAADLAHVMHVLARDFSLPTHAALTELTVLARDLRADDRLVPLEGAGASVDQADTLFADTTHAVVVARRATTVQYATVVALIARELGLDSRLVVGFRLPGHGEEAAPGRYLLGPSDLAAWVEVATTPSQWQIIDPNPRRTGKAAIARFSTTPPTHHALPPASTVTPGPSGHAIAPPVRLHLPASRRPVPRILLALALVVAVLLLAGLAPLANQRRLVVRARRRLRRAPSPRHATTRAWREALDLLERLGFGAPPGWTGSEIVSWLKTSLGAKVAALLEELRRDAERVLFDPAYEPASAQAALDQFDQLHRVLSRRTGLGARWRAGLPRSLRRRPFAQRASSAAEVAWEVRPLAEVVAR